MRPRPEPSLAARSRVDRPSLRAARAPARAAALVLLLLLPTRGAQAQRIDVWSRPRQAERSRTCDFLHYRVSLDFDLEGRTFRGENQISLTPFGDGFETCVLDAEGLVVEAVHDAAGRALSFAQGPRAVEVALGRPYAHGDVVELTVVYRGEDPQAGLFFDDAGPRVPRMVSTDSWPDEARYWIPCYDYPNDKVTHELVVTVPAANRVLSNGRLVGVTEDPARGTTTWHWSQEEPHSTYLFMLAIGPFEVLEDALGDLPLSYWVYPPDVEEARHVFAKTPRMIEFYAELFDYPFPWAKYAQVTTPHVGGGAEATSATILGDRVVHARLAERELSWERVIAHEIAHQWWGDLVTLREWSHTWLNESFATYADYLWVRHEHGADEGAWDLLGKKNQYLDEARARYARPIVFDRYERPDDNFDAHTYPKGACILHELRFLLGDELFFRALRAFLKEHALRSVDTHDFTKAVKDSTGRNLDWFFDQSLLRPGHPVLEVRSHYDESAAEVRLDVAQVQDRARGVPLYRLPVQIGIVTPSGERVETVWLGAERDSFAFPSPERPRLVRFDEGNWLLKEWTYEKGPDELLYQVAHDDAIGREWAARQLARHAGDERVRDALGRALAEDAFWAVRLAALETLAAAAGPPGGGQFRAAAEDASPRLRRAALRALGELGDAASVEFLRARFEVDGSPLARAEALRAIGRCGGRSQVPFLERARLQPSHDDVLRQAAEWALEAIEERGSRER